MAGAPAGAISRSGCPPADAGRLQPCPVLHGGGERRAARARDLVAQPDHGDGGGQRRFQVGDLQPERLGAGRRGLGPLTVPLVVPALGDIAEQLYAGEGVPGQGRDAGPDLADAQGVGVGDPEGAGGLLVQPRGERGGLADPARLKELRDHGQGLGVLRGIRSGICPGIRRRVGFEPRPAGAAAGPGRTDTAAGPGRTDTAAGTS